MPLPWEPMMNEVDMNEVNQIVFDLEKDGFVKGQVFITKQELIEKGADCFISKCRHLLHVAEGKRDVLEAARVKVQGKSI